VATAEASGAPLGVRTQLLDGTRVTLPSRVRLLDQILEETGTSTGRQRLTLLCAPAGYGKTRMVLDWLGDGQGDDAEVRWVRCSSEGAAQMWAQVRDVLAAATGLPIENEADARAESVRLAASVPHALTLVIDDFEHATSAEDDAAIAAVASAHPLLALVVIARHVTVLDGPLVTATMRVRLINTSDLALTLEECHELADSLGFPQSEELTQTFVQTAGWPLAVRAVLNLGSDALYFGRTTGGRPEEALASPPSLDPAANLTAFTRDFFELLPPRERATLLSAAAIDAMSVRHLRAAFSLSQEEAEASIITLVDLGLLIEAEGAATPEFTCHPAVRLALRDLANRTLRFEVRRRLYEYRAKEVERFAPFTAFHYYCSAEAFEAAEIVLAANFTTFTDETERLLAVLRPLPEEVLSRHPTFVAALLMLELPLTTVATSTLTYLGELWSTALAHALPDGVATPPGPIHLPLVCQAMVAARLAGDLHTSYELLRHLESRLTPSYLAETAGAERTTAASAVVSLAGSLPTYLRESASTALMVGDFARARRSLEQLRHHSENRIVKPWAGFSHSSLRTVSEKQSGERWLLAALAELAFTEVLDGNMNRCVELLNEADVLARASGESAPGISWAGAEIARAHLAHELGDELLLQQAADRLRPLGDRLEQWPLLLIAEAGIWRVTRGTAFALTQLEARIEMIEPSLRVQSHWLEMLTAYRAMLHTGIGDLRRSDRLLSECDAESNRVKVERVRLLLFSGQDVEALLAAQRLGDAGLTARQQIDRSLISAVAAWACDRTDEAFEAIRKAAVLLERHATVSTLRGVPHDLLLELAVAARDANVCDLVAQVEAIPEPARCVRYERLTEMELRTLQVISQHRNAAHAANALFVTQGTVKKHLASVYRKLRARNRDEAILFAGRMGLFEGLPTEGSAQPSRPRSS